MAEWQFPVETVQPTKPAPSVGAVAAEDELIPIGGRNDALIRYAGALRRQGATQEELEAALLKRNATRFEEPLSEREVLNVARSATRWDPEPVPDAPETMARSLEDFLSTEVAEPEWLVEGIWPEHAIGFVSGPPKSFKSFYVLEMAFAIATGHRFLSQFGVPKARTVMLIQRESP